MILCFGRFDQGQVNWFRTTRYKRTRGRRRERSEVWLRFSFTYVSQIMCVFFNVAGRRRRRRRRGRSRRRRQRQRRRRMQRNRRFRAIAFVCCNIWLLLGCGCGFLHISPPYPIFLGSHRWSGVGLEPLPWGQQHAGLSACWGTQLAMQHFSRPMLGHPEAWWPNCAENKQSE